MQRKTSLQIINFFYPLDQRVKVMLIRTHEVINHFNKLSETRDFIFDSPSPPFGNPIPAFKDHLPPNSYAHGHSSYTRQIANSRQAPSITWVRTVTPKKHGYHPRLKIKTQKFEVPHVAESQKDRSAHFPFVT